MSLVTELVGYFTVYQCEQCEIHIYHIGPPLNRADGGRRHIAAALFDLEANVRSPIMDIRTVHVEREMREVCPFRTLKRVVVMV